MTLLAATSGTARYNAVVFSTYFSRVSITPVLDSSGRTVKWNKYTFDITGWLSVNGGTTDSTLEDYRRRLLQPGQELQFIDKGLGTEESLHINGNSSIRDANWGPIPEMLSWTPYGDAMSCQFQYRITCHIPDCDGARYDGIMSINWETDWDVDVEGYTTRTITGELEIAQTRQTNSRKVKESAEEYFKEVIPAIPRGFKRETKRRRLSNNRNKLSFTFVDKQMPTPLPPGVVVCDIDQAVSTDLSKAFAIWDVRFSGTVSVPAGSAMNIAARAFEQTVASRLNWIMSQRESLTNDDKARAALLLGVISFGNALLNGQGLKKGAQDGLGGLIAGVGIKGQPLTVLPMSYSVTEKIFGKESRFEQSYRVMGGDLKTILVSSGLWRPIEGTSFATWEQSMREIADPRGQAKLTHVAGDETLIDLCVKPEPKISRSLSGMLPGKTTLRGGLNPRGRAIKEERSWIDYDNRLRVVESNRVAKHKKLPVEPVEKIDPVSRELPDPTGPVLRTAKAVGDNGIDAPLAAAPVRDVVQVLGRPSYLVEMRGFSERLTFKIPVPRLIKVGGQSVRQVSQDVEEYKAGAVGGVPINGLRWVILYEVEAAPQGQLPSLANPVYQTSGG